jgi:steroid delta-isomerase
MLMAPDQPLAATASWFNELSPATLDRLPEIYAPDATFRDPINEGRGIDRIRAIFEDLFEQLEDIQVTVHDRKGDDDSGFILWTMRYRFRGRERKIEGTSHFRFNGDGLVRSQEDHWDASFPIYGEFPVMRSLMKGIRRLVRVKD